MRILKGVTNTVTVTVTENTTLSSPYYLFEFIGASTTPKYCICSDNLTNEAERYDEFEIIETTSSVNPVTHRITLELGTNVYNVYEQASSTNTDTTGLTLVETGLCEVYSNAATTDKTYEATITKKVFNG